VSVLCDYCQAEAVLVDSAEVYHGKSYGMIWLCRPCQAWVSANTHLDNQPNGRLAKADLRAAKRKLKTLVEAFVKAYSIMPAQVMDAKQLGQMDVYDCNELILVVERMKAEQESAFEIV